MTRGSSQLRTTTASRDPEGRRAIRIARAAHLYDIGKTTMRRILREADVLIERGGVHLVRWEDLIRVMEGHRAASTQPTPLAEPTSLSDHDRAAFARASRER